MHEARADRAAAAAAYRASLSLRPSATVQKRLADLEAGAPAAAVAPAAPPAPDPRPARFPDLRGYCAALERHPDDADGGLACLDPVPLAGGVDRVALGPGPIRGVRVIGLVGALDDVTCALWFDTGAGGVAAGQVPCRTTTAVGTDWAAVLALESPGPGRVIARFALGTALRDPEDPRAARFACQELVLACRVDAAGAACTGPAPVGWAAACAPPTPGAPVAIAWDERAPWQLSRDHLIVRPARRRPAPEGVVELDALDLPLTP